MRTSLIFILLAAAAAAQPQVFDYDASAPLRYAEKEIRSADGVQLFDVTFASPRGGTVTAYLVAPVKRNGKIPAIVWQHGGGQNRQWFLPDAFELARAGAASLLLDAPEQRPEKMRAPNMGNEILQPSLTLTQVGVDIRRAYDVLAALPYVDKDRIGFAGLSFGAMIGGSIAGLDPQRFKCYVLMVGLEGFVRHYKESPLFESMRATVPKDDLDRLYKSLDPLDNIHYIGNATAPLLFQAARYDWGVPSEHTYAFFQAAGSPQKSLEWYDCGHMLNDRRAAADRIEWLRKQLKLPLLRIR